MAITFELEVEKVKQPWRTITSLDIKLLKDFNKYKQIEPYNNSQSNMKERLREVQLYNYYKDNELHMDVVKKHCEDTVSSMFKPILFIFTSLDGIVLTISGPQELVQTLDQNHNLGAGSVFTIQNAGLNAISFSIELREWVYLSGSDHDFNLFKEWNCFCSPVRKNDEIIGYLDMSFSDKEDSLWMSALFAFTLKSIEEKLGRNNQEHLIYEQFQVYQLSPREKEIGYMWINNFSALKIASKLGITEGTVRNVIKKIYRKTGVCDKGQFIRKFIS